MGIKILAFAGSTREASFNKQLVRIAAKAAEQAGAEVTLIDLRDFPMPLYDGDLEAESGIPEHGKRFKESLKSHHGFLIASPEYNSSITAVLKNAIDWASRPEPDEPPLVAYSDKFAALMSASPGALGGLRSLGTVRSILQNIGVHVIPNQIAISRANEAFNPDGNLKDPKQHNTVEKIAQKLVHLLNKVHG